MALIDNIISYWKFDEASGAREDQVTTNDLTPVNTPSAITGKINDAVQLLYASNQYLYKNSAVGLNLGSGDFTFSCWFKKIGARTQQIFHYGTESPFASFSISVKNASDNKVGLYINDGSSTSISSTGTITDTNWHQIFVVRSSGTVTFYIDGSSSGSATNSRSLPSSGEIGIARQYKTYEQGDFAQDETGIWSRALSGAEILELYNSGAGLAYPFTPPVQPPVLDTLATDDIAKRSATLNGEITDVGLENADLRGFVWGTSTLGDPGDVAPASAGYDSYNSASGDFGVGVFDHSATSLDPDTTYYVRAWAHNSDGYAYGDEVTFDTLAIVYAISGVATLSGTPVEGATIRCIRQSDNVALDEQTTDSTGAYIFSGLDVADLYHLAIEYTSGGTDYNALSLWDIVPVEV